MKKILFSCCVIFIIIYTFIFPEITVYAARNGIQMWFHQILPALLPFTILSAVVIKSDFLRSFKGNSHLLACYIVISCGFCFGFPVGAKLSADFYKQKLLSEKQATTLAIATNNFSPMYVCGFALSTLFASKEYNMVTYLILYLTPLIIAVIYLLFQMSNNRESNEPKSTFHLNMEIMDNCIISGFLALIKICGYIVLFSIFTEILAGILSKPPFIMNLLVANLEITNGINLIADLEITSHLKYILLIQLLSFGGLSGFAQTGSILFEAGLSMHKYIIGKALLSLLLTLLSVIYVFFIR